MIPISHRNAEVSEKAGSECWAESSWDSEKGGWEPVGPSERKFVLGGSTGSKRVYIRYRREAKKFIPVNIDVGG